ncbi:amidohydrolase family protein [Muricauda sp. CAU 1633]|uniref:amidohydrolase family protein n=1 Tax=Allomuricauda sp. CAU 1633 TaxID=2816036 RepID=UPI001A8E4A8A|nr:amidohydrolase family protein [Muricauda sp. CAU 1633]MBO0322226.1 amidohydrolase family protein [Muricauda sp. CAU 1633]
MKPQTITFLTVLLLLTSCNNQQEKSNSTINDANSTTYTGPIIDMHLHAFHEGHQMLGMTHPPTLRGETFQGATSAEELKNLMLSKFKEHNIVKALVTNAQGWVKEAPDIIINAKSSRDIDELKNQIENGSVKAIAEMTPFFAGILANDSSQIPYFELAQEFDIPIGFHVLPGGPNYGFHILPGQGGMRAYNANPLQLEDVLFKYPDLRLFIMHGGWPYVDDLKAMMYEHPNLYVDIALINWILPQEELNTYLKSLINSGFGDRIMYGSDQMVFPELITIGIQSVNNADFLTLKQKEDIFFNNAAKFLRLSEEEISKLKSP